MSQSDFYDTLFFGRCLTISIILFKVLSNIHMFLKDMFFKRTYSVEQHIISNNILFHQLVLLYNVYGLYD